MRSVRTAEHKIWYGPSGTTEVDLTLVFAARFACPTSSQSTARVAVWVSTVFNFFGDSWAGHNPSGGRNQRRLDQVAADMNIEHRSCGSSFTTRWRGLRRKMATVGFRRSVASPYRVC